MDEVVVKRATNGWIIEFEGVTYVSTGDHAEIKVTASDLDGKTWVVHANLVEGE